MSHIVKEIEVETIIVFSECPHFPPMKFITTTKYVHCFGHYCNLTSKVTLSSWFNENKWEGKER
jgi:hypothetical protein